MSKKNQAKAKEQPSYIQQLLSKGTVVLTAKNREDFAELIDQIPASIRYGAGAIGKNPDTGIFSLRIDLVK